MSLKPKKWKFTQVFGNSSKLEKNSNEDITSIEFTNSGNYLLIGDNIGRLIIFKKYKNEKRSFCEYSYLNEIKLSSYNKKNIFNAKYQEFINNLKVLPKQSKNELFLITNDNKIKLLKLKTKKISQKENKNIINRQNKLKNEQFNDKKFLHHKEIAKIELKREFPDFHKNSINSISLSLDGERFLSSDDFSILLWDLENTKISYNLKNIDSNIKICDEIITKSEFSNKNDYSFIFGTSKGDVYLNDLRQKMDLRNSKIFSEEKKKNFNYFSKITKFVSDLKFGVENDTVYIRDFLSIKIWDLKMDKKPILNFELFPYKKKITDFYNNDCICEKFDLSLSQKNNFLLTGNFDNKFHIYDFEKNINLQYKVSFNKKTKIRNVDKNFFFDENEKFFDFKKKILKTAWNPGNNSIVVASGNCLFFYNSKIIK